MVKKFIQYIANLHKKLSSQYWRARSRYIKYFETLPLNENAILMEAQHGREINGNIYYLLKYLANNSLYQKYDLYLSARKEKMNKFQAMLELHEIRNVHILLISSDEYCKVLATAKYLINDNGFLPFFIKKEGQIYFNTWHGTPFKTLGRKTLNDPHRIGNTEKNFVSADYLLFPNYHTRDCIIRDYMLENISSGSYILAGYPRNEAFFDLESRDVIRANLQFSGKKIYAYMPTFRGTFHKVGTAKNDAYLLYFLYELDKHFLDDELLYVNLHPIAHKNIKFAQFKHIVPFPKEYETYEFLNAVDTLITDYSSVLFDFACSGKKIVLFPYDQEDYLRDRGTYFNIDDLPFPIVNTVDTLLQELRTPKQYNDNEFLKMFCPWDRPDVSRKLCDCLILGQDTGLSIQRIPDNGKENVLLHVGNLAANGVTTSLRSLSNIIDLHKRNYYITFMTEGVARNGEALFTFPEKLCYFPFVGDMNLTIRERIIRKLFKLKILSASCYMSLLGHRVHQDLLRKYGPARFDTVIQFNGYENEVILCLSTFKGKKTIFVHNDMIAEIKTRGNQRRDVLAYAYQKYDKVAEVTTDLFESIQTISKGKGNIVICKNAIDNRGILEKAEEAITIEPATKVFPSKERFFELINSNVPKFINVGRFSPEKGHERLIKAFYCHWQSHPNEYLFIMGGSSRDGYYQKTIDLIQSLGLESHVILLCQVLNPYPIIKACDYFILSSFYEGFGLVLAEADILGKPIVSTDIVGPRTFMKEHGGILVENSEEGILSGIKMLADGKVQPLNVDYEAYNKEVIQEFEQLFE